MYDLEFFTVLDVNNLWMQTRMNFHTAHAKFRITMRAFARVHVRTTHIVYDQQRFNKLLIYKVVASTIGTTHLNKLNSLYYP